MSVRVFYHPELPKSLLQSVNEECEREGKTRNPVEPLLAIALNETLSSGTEKVGLTPEPDEPINDYTWAQAVPKSQPTFEAAFRRFEPMFHTVFYRKYHPDVLADAKQVALLALYKKWCKDKTLLDQSASFVTTAAIWGISNWRKKEMKRIPHEKPLIVDNHGYVLGEPKHRNPRSFSDALDFRLDLAQAIDTVLLKLSDHPDYKHIYAILRDVIADVPFTESWKRTSLVRGRFKQYRDLVKAELAGQLSEYRRLDD